MSNLLNNLRQYKISFEELCERLSERLAIELQEMAQKLFFDAKVDITPKGEYTRAEVSVTHTKQGNVCVVMAEGEEVYFVEFGAGVYYNGPVGTSPHPYGSQLGMTIGSYGPKGAQATWGFYQDGELVLTHGTPASQPMYNAMKYVCDEIDRIAREVFL